MSHRSNTYLFFALIGPSLWSTNALAWESSRENVEMYVEERNHLRLDFALPSDFNADPTGHAVVMALGARLHLSESRHRDNLGLVVQAPFIGRIDFNRFDVGNVLLALEHRPSSLLEGRVGDNTERTGLRYGVMLPTLSTATAAELGRQRRNLALAMGGMALLDAGHYIPGVVGATFDYFTAGFDDDPDGALLVEFRAGASLLFPIEDAASFVLPVHMTFRVGFGGSLFLFCLGSTMSASIGGSIDEMSAAITASMGALAQFGSSRVDLMFDIGGALGAEFMPTLVTTMRLGWTLVL